MVEVIYFPKKCPECRSDMKTVQKPSGWYYQCDSCELIFKTGSR